MLNKNYSKLIIPISVCIDISILFFLVKIILPLDFNIKYFYFFISISWIVLSINLNYYKVYRFIKPFAILIKNIKQFVYFLILCYAFSGFYFDSIKSFRIANYVLYCFLIILTIDLVKFFLLKFYRSVFKRNYVNVILFGNGENTNKLYSLLKKNQQYGYNIVKYYTNIHEINTEGIIDGNNEENIKEFYISLNKTSKEFIKSIKKIAEIHLIDIKYVPENKDLLSYDYKIEYYSFIPIFSLQKSFLQDPIIAGFKRTFDLIFSLLVIILLLSWFIPIMAILIKLESKGPVFFKQSRPGFDEKEFFCYKFRSMKINQTTEKEASRNDPRVTKIGKFIRKTSIDELPQFFNVLFGDMSIVGPRPHLWTQNKVYGKKIDRYMMRHYVKPGITGLAQVRGYRGEIETDNDMINRINYDVYYIENWSFLLDIKIIIQTVVNIFKGEEKAY